MPGLSEGAAATIARSCAAVSDVYRQLFRRRHGPHPQIRAVAVLVWFLSSCPWLAVVYLQQRRLGSFDVSVEMVTMELAALTMLDWFKDDQVRPLVMAAIGSLDHPTRVRADEFLMHTCLVGLIVDHNQRGLTMALPQAVQTYLRLWSYRPMADCTARKLHRLVWHKNSRRRFGVLLRRNFMLVLTTLPQARALSRDEQLARVTRTWFQIFLFYVEHVAFLSFRLSASVCLRITNVVVSD